MASGCYVYAILARATPLPPGPIGFGGAVLSTVPWRGLAAATSPVDWHELRPTPDHVLRHEAVVEAVRQGVPALPVRFGTVLADREAVARSLAERYEALVADLERLGDKVELGLSVLWDAEDLPPQLPSPGRGGAGGEVPGPGTRYLLARLAEARREAGLRARAEALARALDEVLRPHALECQSAVLPTARLALRAAYLLEPARVSAFQEAFEQVRRACPGLLCLLSGPWPPYSFVTPEAQSPRPKVESPMSRVQELDSILDSGPWTRD